MAVIFVTDGLVGVVHILASINVEVFFLAILNFPHISLDLWSILSEISTKSWLIET
jgi:hypothetical protein